MHADAVQNAEPEALAPTINLVSAMTESDRSNPWQKCAVRRFNSVCHTIRLDSAYFAQERLNLDE